MRLRRSRSCPPDARRRRQLRTAARAGSLSISHVWISTRVDYRGKAVLDRVELVPVINGAPQQPQQGRGRAVALAS